MKFMNPRNSFLLMGIFLLMSVLMFFIGMIFAKGYSDVREMQSLEEELVRNMSIFSECKIRQCSDEFQNIFIERNESILKQYAFLSSEIESPWYAKPGQSVWPLVFLISSERQSVKSEKTLREYYKKIGCGLNGIICRHKMGVTEVSPKN